MNPFTLPTNDNSLFLYREQQRILKSEHDKETRAVPIYHRSPEIKIQILSELKKLNLPSHPSPAKFRRNSIAAIKEELQEFIHRKRDIFLVKKSIENKLKNIDFLETSITEKEKKQRDFCQRLEDQLHTFEIYEEKLMLDSRKKAENTKKKYMLRNKLQESLEKTYEEIESLQIKLEKKIEELSRFEKIKEFVEDVSQNLNQKTEASMFVTEENLLFKNSLQILELLDSYESRSLYLVKQIEIDEQELDSLKSLNQIAEAEIESDLNEVRTQVRGFEKLIENLEEKTGKFKEGNKGNNIADEGIFNEIHFRLNEMLPLLGIEDSLKLSDLGILEIIENNLKKLTEKCGFFPEESVRRLERETEKNRRNENIEKLKEIENRKIRENNEMIEHRKKKVVKKKGRKVLPKSKITEEAVVVENKEVSRDYLDQIEFFGEG